MERALSRVAFLALLVLTKADWYYVKPSSNTPCPEEGIPCFTLSQYASKSSDNYFTSNTTLILLPGNHSLDAALSIQNILLLSVETLFTKLDKGITLITCYQSARFTFESINVVSMRGLVLFGCVNNIVTGVEKFTLEDCSLDGQGRNGTGLLLNEVSTANITTSSFSSNTGLSKRAGAFVGGAIIILNSTMGITFSSCTFDNNTVTGAHGAGGAVYAYSSPITIVNSKFNSNTVSGDDNNGTAIGGAVFANWSSPIIIVNTIFTNNNVTGDIHAAGGALAVVYGDVSITVVNSTFTSNTVTGNTGDGGAVYADSSPGIAIVSSTLNNNTVTVTGSDGNGGAVFAYSSTVTIVNSSLYWNNVTGPSGAGGALFVYLSLRNTLIVNSTLNSNTVTGSNYESGGAVYAQLSAVIMIVNCTLINNTVTGDIAAGGAVLADSSPVIIINSMLNNNTVTGADGRGGAMYTQFSLITMVNSTLSNNTATGDAASGGAVCAFSSPNITIYNSTLKSNTVTGLGAALNIWSTPITIANTTLNDNTAVRSGGAVYANLTSITIHDSIINSNTVTADNGTGGALLVVFSSINITNCVLNSNSVTGVSGTGGAVSSGISSVIIVNSTLNSNTVIGWGGAVYVNTSPNVTVINSTFNNNISGGYGSVFWVTFVTFISIGVLDIQNNIAGTGTVYAVESMLIFTGNTTVSNNYGSLFAYSNNVTIMGHINIVKNIYVFNITTEGGALTAYQSEVVFIGRVNLVYNRAAVRGGAIAATESKLYVFGEITVSHNTASESGGGIYAYQSELNFKQNVTISRNSANVRGGGIYAISSTIRLTDESKTNIIGNHAKRGGGMCLEGSAKVYLLKKCLHYNYSNSKCNVTLQYHNNTADYGGAVYVADDTTSGTCYATPLSELKSTIDTECFIQELDLSQHIFQPSDNGNTISIYFTHDNSATVAGDILYGGLLDRCAASPFAEIFQKNYNSHTLNFLSAESYILNISDLEVDDFNSTKMISSDPVRICFCKDNQPNCSYHLQPKYVRKGEKFTVSLVAVDHINNTRANSIIHAFASHKAKLGEGQSSQQTSRADSCADLTYSILSPYNSEKLHLYADGPCKNAGISMANLTVNIALCPIGFVDNDLLCECDPILSSEYVSNCSIDSKTVQRKNNVWFAYVNTTHHQGYMLHKHCPFDYCHPPSENISVNLNIEKGANELCAFNRSGKLCGTCEDGLSLSLGSSRCRPCSNNWLALLIGFAIAGVALVAFILKLNFTVAEGTFNGLIFYANIFVANRAIYFPCDETKIMTVFIAWLNLDFGFETCFYDGLDGYAKTWLQFAFPLYVISLVVAIIIISDYSVKFARLFTGKNPIATLATLILLSYTKLLRTIIASLSFTTLQYSDGSQEVVWLIDANIPYFSGKHIPLFITALVVAIVGTTYTFILFAWQWLVHCPNRGPLRWIIGNTKVIGFMDAYHNPYNKDHRYWIGLLLLVRVALYLVSAVNVLGDPRINLCSINSAIVIIHTLKHLVESKRKVSSTMQLKKVIETILSRKVHKDHLSEILELISLLNLAGLTIATFFITRDEDSQNVVAYISTSIAFVTFLAILFYHVYQFVLTELLHKIKLKLHMLRGPHDEVQIERPLPVALDNEPVSETEFDALPVPVDTISIPEDEQFVTTEDDEDIGTANMQTGPSNTHYNSSESSQPSDKDNQPPTITQTRNDLKVLLVDLETPTQLVQSQSKPLNNQAHRLSVDRKTSSSSLTGGSPHIPASCNEKTPIEIELPNMASGHECSTLHDFLQPSVLIESSPLEDDDHQSEDECTPLLPQGEQ